LFQAISYLKTFSYQLSYLNILGQVVVFINITYLMELPKNFIISYNLSIRILSQAL